MSETTGDTGTDSRAGSAPVRALEARYYTDPAVYECERASLFSRTWHFAGHVSGVPRAGDYFCFSVAGEDLFCIRGRDGSVRTFYNVCQHRAHQLLSGRGNTAVIVCPYHAWSYALNGSLRTGPNIASAGIRPGSVCLSALRTEILHGFIFVNPDPQARSLDEWFPGVREELATLVPDIADLCPLEWVEIPEQCNWKVSIENYSECYHCALNHPTFSGGVVRAETYNVTSTDGSYVLRHTTDCQAPENMTYAVDPARPHATTYRSFFLWPAFSFQVYPGNVLNTYHWRVHGVDRCTVWRGWYTPGGREDDTVRRLARQDRETTVAEDIRLVESVHRGLRSRGYTPGPLVLDPRGGLNSEHSIHRLHQWFREALAASAAPGRQT